MGGGGWCLRVGFQTSMGGEVDLKLLIIVYACISFFGFLTKEGVILEPSTILNKKILPLEYKKNYVMLRDVSLK